MNRNHNPIDIVIPVYNGYEDLQLCMDSIRKYTDLSRHYVLLINDCSPDERIQPYLDGQVREHITVIHNEKNMGFSANVNKGMDFSDRDVILLNSDTIVTANWIEKIQACAYRFKSIGTVTPLSNSATLCSVPVFCQDNPVPEGFSVDEYAALVEKCSLRRYPKITVAVGFCMYIKKQVIEEVGYFDAETFQRGYGEENDFCNRVIQLGYCHVLCDDTFIYHRGTASFDTEEKLALSQAHDKILRERYPELMHANDVYCRDNPDQEIRDNLNFYTKINNGRKNLLYVLHLDFQSDAFNSIGGTQLHVRDLTMNLKEEYNIFVAARDKDTLRLTCYVDEKPVVMKFFIGEAGLYPVFYDDKLREIFEKILKTMEIHMVHVHHTAGLSLDIYHLAKELDIPVVATLHDYYYGCPTIKLLDDKNRFCPMLEEKDCAGCLYRQGICAEQTKYLEKWQKESLKGLSCCSKLIFPSESARTIMTNIFPDIKDKGVVIPHGSDYVGYEQDSEVTPRAVEKSAGVHSHLDRMPGTHGGFNYICGWAYLDGADNKQVECYLEITDAKGKVFLRQTEKKARPDVQAASGQPGALWCGIQYVFAIEGMAEGPCRVRILLKHQDAFLTNGNVYKGDYQKKLGEAGRLNVAFIGGMVPAKGSRMVSSLLRLPNSGVNWFVMGAVGDRDLNEDSDQGRGLFSGVYEKDDIFALLRSCHIDVVCVLPVWAETFCYTVSEAWMCRIPVIGTQVGAVGERIQEFGGGWTVPVDITPEELMEFLMYLKEHPQEIEEKKEEISRMHMVTVEEMCEKYRDFYQDILKENPKNWSGNTGDYDYLFQAMALGNPQISGTGPVAAINKLAVENKRLQDYLNMLEGTTSYRIARKLSEANIPFKESLKKILKR